jgi:hypothetical protein
VVALGVGGDRASKATDPDAKRGDARSKRASQLATSQSPTAGRRDERLYLLVMHHLTLTFRIQANDYEVLVGYEPE